LTVTVADKDYMVVINRHIKLVSKIQMMQNTRELRERFLNISTD